MAFPTKYGEPPDPPCISELYVALDESYIVKEEFDNTYEQARRTRAAIHGFIKYLKTYKDNLPQP